MRTVAALFLFPFLALAGGSELQLYNWADYMTGSVLEEFTKETGIPVKQNYFASNEELLAKLQSGAFAYDVVVPSDYYVRLLIDQGLLAPLDPSKLPNRKYLESRFQNPPYDRENRYSVPYFWGTTGIGYNKKRIPEAPKSWKALSDPRWKRKINVLDDMREVLAAQLKLSGRSANERDPALLRALLPPLLRQKEIVRTYNSSTYAEILAAGDVWITQAYSGDIIQRRRENPDLGFVIPEEGGTLFVDNLVIPTSSKKIDEAHLLLNFLLRPDIAEKLSEKLLFATPNREAHARLPERIRNDPAIYPPEGILSKSEYIEDVGPALGVYEEVWTDLKTQ